MGGTVPTSRESAFEIARVLAEHKGGEVVVLDLALQSGWTDFFVIATATSSTHLRGLDRFAEEWAALNKVERRNTPRIADDEEWVLLDLGDVVVHLMTERARAFYELEKLWFQSEAVRVQAPEAPGSPPGGAAR
ncbi:MAG: ribosome silencing factor [Spirochaetaceae bacterium]|nr:ribosome silencing factor [Spirochaetaceae bacterium]